MPKFVDYLVSYVVSTDDKGTHYHGDVTFRTDKRMHILKVGALKHTLEQDLLSAEMRDDGAELCLVNIIELPPVPPEDAGEDQNPENWASRIPWGRGNGEDN